MSFVAFPARFPGNPPAPFSPFDAGETVFYLVGIAAADGLPAPGSQLSVFTDTVEGEGRNPVDTVTETAKGWRGRRRVTVATRTYSWERYVRGAKAAARDAAQWQGADGGVMVLWSYLVTVDDAAALGYRTPRSRTMARPGRRGVGRENNAAATVRNGRAAVLTAEQERTAAVRARAYQAQANARATGRPVSTPQAAPAPQAAPEAPEAPAAPQARPEGLSRLAHVLLDVFDGRPEPEGWTPNPDLPEPGVERFRLLDLD